MRTIPFFLVFIFCFQIFGYDFQSLEKQLKSIEANQNPEELYGVLYAAMQEIIQQAPFRKSKASARAISAFFDSKYIPGTFFHPWEYSDFVGYSWDLYSKFLRAYAQLNKLTELNPQYAAHQFQQGIVSENLITFLMESLDQAKIIPILASQVHPAYHCHYGFQPLEEEHNKVNKYLLLEERQLDALRPILEELKIQVANCIGSPWKVVNVRCWKTHPKEIQYQPRSGWHSDGFPYDVKKIMLYPKGCSLEMGTTQFEFSPYYHVEGPPGTWILFENTKISHRGICPKKSPWSQDRLVVEITLAPHFEFDLKPVTAGLLAMWPLIPWGEDYKKTRE